MTTLTVELHLELPNAENYNPGDKVVVVTGSCAGIWKRCTPVYEGRHGPYLGAPLWQNIGKGSSCPVASAVAEMVDLAKTARYLAGEGSRRAAWPGPSETADKALERAIELKDS